MIKNKVSMEELLTLITEVIEDKKGINPVVLDVQKSGSIFDFMVIATGEARPHLKAIIREIELRVKKLGIKGTVWEGAIDSGWMLFDLGSIIVHIMSEDEREYYNLEELWGKEATIYH